MTEQCHILDALEPDHSDEACSILCKETASESCCKPTERPLTCSTVRGTAPAMLGLAATLLFLLFAHPQFTTEQLPVHAGMEPWSHGSIVSLLASNSTGDDAAEEDNEPHDEASSQESREDVEEQAKLSMQQEMEAAAQDAQEEAVQEEEEAVQEEQALTSEDDAESQPMEKHKPVTPHIHTEGKPHLPFNCSAGFKYWAKGWSYSKREWCCNQSNRGCESFNCKGSDTMWSIAEKNWCCNYKNLGCTTAGYTKVAVVKNDFNAVDDDVHDKVSLKRGELVWVHSKTDTGWTYVLSRARKHPGWAPGHYLSTSRAVICVRDHLTATGDRFQPQLSVHAGDTLWVIKQLRDKHSHWTYAYAQGLEGWVPSFVLSFSGKPDSADIRAACAVQDFQASGGEDAEVSVKAGQVVWAVDDNGNSNWTWIITTSKKGRVPSKVLKATTAVLVQKAFPADGSSEPGPQLPVMRGDTVWATHVRKSDWIYASSRGSEGWLPVWAVRQPDFGGKSIQAARHPRSGTSCRTLSSGMALMGFLSLLDLIGVC
mmetsp:Transcript_103432/g.205585  ORF Transcript_103432/g.205585 Transcript_103432/m.205585 type:complete len:541 (+) Transcript_103432:52-1674(+)